MSEPLAGQHSRAEFIDVKSGDVFISYSGKDKIVADAVCHALEQQNIRCWIAPRDVIPGSDWGESISDAITFCKVVVLVFSKYANESHHVRNEILAALEAGRPIIPFRIQDVLPAGPFKLHLTGLHWLDAITPPLEEHLAELVATVRRVLQLRNVKNSNNTPAYGGPEARASSASRNIRWRPVILGGAGLSFVAASALTYFLMPHSQVVPTRSNFASPTANVPSQAGQAFRVYNRSAAIMDQIYISPVQERGWGMDWLGQGVLKAGEMMIIRLPAGQCINDIRVVFADNRALERRRFDVCSVDHIEFK